MKKWMYLLIIFIGAMGCDEFTEEYLYDENDPEYALALQLAEQECISGATIFNVLDTAGDFLNTEQEGKIYKISQDANNPTTLYVYIQQVTASAMTIAVNSSETGYRKIINFTKTNHDELLAALKTMACNSLYDDYVSVSGLDDNDQAKLTWKRESIGKADDDDADDIPELYDRETNVYVFDKDLPLLFYYWNAEKTSKRVLEEDAAEVETKSVITITDVTSEQDCDQDNSSSSIPITACDFNDVTSFPTCDVTVNSTIFSTSSYGNNLISLSSTNSKTCTLLQSAGVTIQN